MSSFHPRLKYRLGKIIKLVAVTISTEQLDYQDFLGSCSLSITSKVFSNFSFIILDF